MLKLGHARFAVVDSGEYVRIRKHVRSYPALDDGPDAPDAPEESEWPSDWPRAVKSVYTRRRLDTS